MERGERGGKGTNASVICVQIVHCQREGDSPRRLLVDVGRCAICAGLSKTAFIVLTRRVSFGRETGMGRGRGRGEDNRVSAAGGPAAWFGIFGPRLDTQPRSTHNGAK